MAKRSDKSQQTTIWHPRGIRSPNIENVRREADPRGQLTTGPGTIPKPPQKPPRKSSSVVPLSDHPRAAEILSHIAKQMERWDVNVALLAQRKYMINDCLGLKVSMGEFSVRLGNSNFTFGEGWVQLTFAIKRISFNALALRMRPNLGGGNPCHFGGRFQVGGSASDITLALRLQPRVDIEECKLISLGSLSVDVHIGGLNLKPLQNNLDDAARWMIEDALVNTFNILSPDRIELAAGSLPQLLCLTKYDIYTIFFAQLSSGVQMSSLPQAYIDKLQSFYPHLDLRTVRFGLGKRQLYDAMTDCTDIYFNDRAYVDGTRNESLPFTSKDHKVNLYHELRHAEQCAELGGREAYADRWFTDVEWSLLLSLIKLTSGASAWDIHERMPMEADAHARENQVYNTMVAEQIELIIQTVAMLVADHQLDQAHGNRLTYDLQQAIDALNHGDESSAAQQLTNFISDVDSLIQSGAIAADSGAMLEALAQPLEIELRR